MSRLFWALCPDSWATYLWRNFSIMSPARRECVELAGRFARGEVCGEKGITIDCVEGVTKGKVVFIHIPDTIPEGWAMVHEGNRKLHSVQGEVE